MLQARDILSWHALKLINMLSLSFLPRGCRPGTWLFDTLQRLGRTHVLHACPPCTLLQTLHIGCHCGRFLADAASRKCFKEGSLLPPYVCRPPACRRALRGARRRCWRPRSPRCARAASAWRPGTRCRPCWTSTPERRARVLTWRAALALRLGLGLAGVCSRHPHCIDVMCRCLDLCQVESWIRNVRVLHGSDADKRVSSRDASWQGGGSGWN